MARESDIRIKLTPKRDKLCGKRQYWRRKQVADKRRETVGLEASRTGDVSGSESLRSKLLLIVLVFGIGTVEHYY